MSGGVGRGMDGMLLAVARGRLFGGRGLITTATAGVSGTLVGEGDGVTGIASG